MNKSCQTKVVLVTGTAGFIGFHVARLLLEQGWRVVGVDSLSDYYDVKLKRDRQRLLLEYENFTVINEKIETPKLVEDILSKHRPSHLVHLAAQAGVRYSIENPRSYLESNIVGTFEILEAARKYPPEHILLASTSSVYGANPTMPYREFDKADLQMSFYAATKKSTESMAHSYAHLYRMPITMFRFFTVYGPWGRPDMALFKFTKALLDGDPIDVYNNGEMSRDFTFIDDLVRGISLLMPVIPRLPDNELLHTSASLADSPIAPFRVVNIGNGCSENLMDFINELEKSLEIKAKINFMPMQPGDVPATWADTSFLRDLTGYSPSTSIKAGVSAFTAWYRDYYKV